MMETSSHPSEIVAYHKIKRIFLNLVEMEEEDDPNNVRIQRSRF